MNLAGSAPSAAQLAEWRQDVSEPLSDEDIQLLCGPTNIIRYPNLADAKQIEQVFDSRGRVFILFLTESQNSGHWLLVHRTGPKTIEYYDSYGGAIDQPFAWLSDAEEAALGQQRKELTRLLRDAQARGYTVQYNPVDLQSKKGSIATCGRHAVVRALLHDWPLQSYIQLVANQPEGPDLFVTAVTETLEDLLRS